MDLNERLEQAVIHAVGNLLDTMIPLSFRRGQQTDADGSHLLGTIDVRGRLNGSIAVSMPVPLAVDMASLMLDEPFEEVTDDVYETVAEMTNIIAGGIKTFLCQQEEIFQLGLPQVLELTRFDARQDGHRVAIPIETAKGVFVVISTLYETPAVTHG
ncbi:MAG: hypothetical protein CVV27_16245 [Candidatus Melainabacteria bacterium HGW-Melainabacteria-1]|nr:MAG: hypothetical protein CVV27_16245 [Candidatus Melainabacteria bacterium HGW-Melainabacteria-1]